ncbi:MAG: DUF2254 domain-containing protein [Rhodothermales bacterium]
MTVSAIALALFMLRLEGVVSMQWAEGVALFSVDQPEGARTLLSTIAGSMIGVAGVTFSITIAAVSFTSGQFGPRIVTNFMEDRGNQITLGTFIATFVYCLVLLRTVRSVEEGSETVAFVPHIGILGALVFAMASLGVLIYFIHHVPESMHISNVIASLGTKLHRQIDTLFPEDVGESKDDVQTEAFAQRAQAIEAKSYPVHAEHTGYVQHLDLKTVMALATKHEWVIRLRYHPGDFVSAQKPLLHVASPLPLSDETKNELRLVYALGPHRTHEQDVLAIVDVLVEMAARALSPGVNDPFTAMNCLDWLGSALLRVAQVPLPDPYRVDDEGALRLIVDELTFATFVEAAFQQLRPYVAADVNAALHALKVMEDVGVDLPEASMRTLMAEQVRTLVAGSEAALASADAQLVSYKGQRVLRALAI